MRSYRKGRRQLLGVRPDLPGCVASGGTIEEVESQIREAIEFHLEGMREHGTPIPPPASRVDYVDIAA